MKYYFVLDPGHGGDDPGASGIGIIEKDLVLDISKEMYNIFQSLGVPVYITRLDDSTLSPDERTRLILNAFGNDPNVIVISNHINAGGGDGAEIIYALRNKDTLSNLIADEIIATGQNYRKSYQRRLPSDSSKDYYFIHRNTGVTEPIIVEYGFLDSTADDPNLLKSKYKDLANAVVRGVSKYIDLPYQIGEVYIVKKGDSLWSIARAYNTTVDELKKLNNLSTNLLSVGQILKIPVKSEVENYNIYTVAKGDTLYKIANQFGVTVNDIITANNLKSNTLQIGQKLSIPILKQENIEYYVQSGDSLWSIARKFNTTVDEIKKLNNLTTNLLNINQRLLIPKETDNNISEEQKYYEYTVISGDTLYSIARKYNTTVNELLSYNNLSSTALSLGQKIKIPIEFVYTVKKGDTLYSIAQNYNTTVDNIKKKNNLTSNSLSIGQLLLI
ncbi:MAG: LysM peptidoglycan-binding domain-containing protein [Bacilli bacterium]|nr:LysM peptidoglycan-binding domain-containing protein [Bacilli bacterium]